MEVKKSAQNHIFLLYMVYIISTLTNYWSTVMDTIQYGMLA